jgi:DNA-directed RNA polymerase subunit L
MSKEELVKLSENTKAVKWEDLDVGKQSALTREFNTMEIARCYKTDERGEPNDFTFTIESVGIQPIPAIMQAGLAALEAIAKQYSNMDTTLADNVTLTVGDARFPCVDVHFKEEGHTLGNLLETLLIDDHVAGTIEPHITYAGYKVPHPLRKEMFVRIGFPEGDSEVQQQTARSVIAVVCRKIIQEARALQQSWAAASGM